MDARTTLTPERLARFVSTLDALTSAGKVGIAVSGGPDSLALLLLAHAARPGGVVAATVDHRLRTESAAEATMVAGICKTLAIPHAILPVTVPDSRTGIQAAARQARYAALTAWATQAGASSVATAHHADDQAETILMRLARGAGLAGLTGIRRSRPLTDRTGIRLIRPLLDWTKSELEEIVVAARLVPARDPSNTDVRYDRTRARTLLARGWPDATRVASAAAHLAEAEEALCWMCDRLGAERIRWGENRAELDMSDLPTELRRRLLLAVFAKLAPEAVLRGTAVDRLLRALDHGKVATLAGWRCDPGPPWRVRQAAARRSR